MSINWVMLDPKQGFVRLPAEKQIFASPSRTGFSITTPRAYPGNNPLSIQSNAGVVYLTNQRIVYLPASPTPAFQSFSAPLINLHDSHVSAPIFGPNVWQAILQSVPGGGLPPNQAHIEIKLIFKDGGAFDFHTTFERIKERFHEAIATSRESAMTGGSSSNQGRGEGPMAGVNLDDVHLDELPTYQNSGLDQLAPQPPAVEPRPPPPPLQEDPVPSFDEAVEGRVPAQRQSALPTDAPPGYEETQQQSIERELEARLAKAT